MLTPRSLNECRPRCAVGAWRPRRFIAAIVVGIAAAFGAPAHAQVMSAGDAVVTGFSGVKPSEQPVPPGGSPLDEFFIDMQGASAQILSLAAPGGAPQGQLIAAPPKLQIRADQVGQVFAIGLDDGMGGKTPDIYLGATSAYGLNIVLPDADGDGAPERVKTGHPNAQFMAGQFGPNGGPGSIWQVNGESGAVSLFATLPDNSGAGIGDLVFHKASRQFFVSDLDNGLIYRLGENGAVIDSFDHGVDGRPAKGLAALPDDGSQLDIKNPAFDSEKPDTWGYTQKDRMVWGLALSGERLFYAVAGGQQVWSIGITLDGAFADDARWEFDANGLPGDGPITDMLFDAEGRLTLAQRGAARGSYDYSQFAEPGKSAVVRFRLETPDDPATESRWEPEPDEYAIGLPPEHTQAEGGIALGYAHDESGAQRTGACNVMLWSTGHRLRPSEDAEAVEGVPENDVHGLQGADASLVRPENAPPTQSYFADYDGFFGDAAKSGHMGDVEIWQPCEGVSTPKYGQLPPGYLPPLLDPPGDFPPDWIPPGWDYETNLRLKKWSDPKTCVSWGAGWLCRYRVRITNTGPDAYFGPILVRDWLPAAPAGAVMGFSGPWACWATPGPATYRCWRPGVFLIPGASVELTAFAWVPKTYDKCHLTNGAAIEWAPPGSVWNSNPTDDIDFASAAIPSKECKPDIKETDLKIYKEAVIDCFENNGGLRCGYKIRVENQGPGAYNGDIVVEDTIPAGTTAIFSGPGGWDACPNVGNTHTCTYANASLPNPGDDISLFVRIDLSKERARQLGCKVRNRAKIVEAPGGSDMNTDPNNDEANAIANVPAEICEDGPKRRSNLKIKKTEGGLGMGCQIGGGVDWCHVFKITVTNTGPNTFNGVIKVTDIAPAGLTVGANGPGWACAGATCITNPAVSLQKNPPSADEASFSVVVSGTADQAKALNCKLTNKARIDAPLGAPRNILAGDDADQITVDLPEKFCKQPASNLKIEKIASPKLCEKAGDGWWCTYQIRVINTGPGEYNAPIEVEEALPAQPEDATWNAPWTCEGMGGGGGAICKHPITTIAVNASKILTLKVKFSNEVVKEKGCKLPNVAKIKRPAPGSPKNTNPGDDIAGDSALVPEEFCAKEPANLELKKYGAQPQCNIEGGKWRCPYAVIVKNTGPGVYSGKVVVKDWLPANAAGATMTVQAPWTCVGAAPSITCTHPHVDIPSSQQVVMPVEVLVTPSANAGCSLLNTARILEAPGGSLQNQNAGDDQHSASLDFPPIFAAGQAFCHTPVPAQPCPPGFKWDGERCDRPVKDRECPRGWTDTPVKGKCCPPGKPWNSRTRECGREDTPPPPPPTLVCPPYTTGSYPNCRPVVGQCRPGFVGTPPNCRRVPDPTCPAGTRGRYPDCKTIVKRCPDGYVGRFPNCRKRPVVNCPVGTTGKYPKCKPIVRKCPKGYIGRVPNCRKIVVDPPRCRKGFVGRPPNCRRIVTPPKVCPPGTIGRPPRCRRVERPGRFDPRKFRSQRGGPQRFTPRRATPRPGPLGFYERKLRRG